jgi:hypothetical protein
MNHLYVQWASDVDISLEFSELLYNVSIDSYNLLRLKFKPTIYKYKE